VTPFRGLVNVVAFVALAATVLGLAIGGGVSLARAKCDAQATALDYPWHYEWPGGCIVELDDGRLVPIRNLKVDG